MGRSKSVIATRTYLVHHGELLVGQDIYWQLSGVDGHDRHQWIIDEFELGDLAAEQLSFEKHLGGPARVLEYNERMQGWLLEVGDG